MALAACLLVSLAFFVGSIECQEYRFLDTKGDCHNQNNDPLITLTPDDIFEIVSSLAKSRDRQLQKKFYFCEDIEPKRIVRVVRKCQVKIVSDDLYEYYDILAKKPHLIEELYQCISDNSPQLNTKEKRQMVAFEDCGRKVYKELKRRGFKGSNHGSYAGPSISITTGKPIGNYGGSSYDDIISGGSGIGGSNIGGSGIGGSSIGGSGIGGFGGSGIDSSIGGSDFDGSNLGSGSIGGLDIFNDWPYDSSSYSSDSFV